MEKKADWKKCILDKDALIKDVLINFETTGLQIVLIASKNLSLIGVITDGDIRRAFLSNLTTNSKASEVMTKTPITIKKELSHMDAIELMKLKQIRHIPIVDEKNFIQGIHFLDKINSIKERENLLVIMAGGFGKRLAPYTKDCPKPMLKINGKPMLEHIIEKAISEGFKNFVISVFYLSEKIKNYFEDGSKWNANISYLNEKEPLGTAGALSMIDPIPSSSIVVTNGDVITNIKYSEILKFHNEKKIDATMAVKNYEWQNPFGVVTTDGLEIESFEEKPVYRSNINAGVYAFKPETLILLKKNTPCDMPDFFRKISKKGKSIVFPAHESWIDIGRKEDLDEVNKK